MCVRCFPTSVHMDSAGHQKRAGETVRGFLVIERRIDLEHEMPQFVRQVESLALGPVMPVDDDDGSGGAPCCGGRAP